MFVEHPRPDGVAEGPATRVPWLGWHTDAVLTTELGLSDDEAGGVIRP
jgi:hypothetical protein